MSKVTEIAFTGYPITNVKRARAFYEGLFGLKQSMSFGGDDEAHAWIEYDVGPHTLALVKVGEQWKPSSDGPAAALEVSDFDGVVATLRDAGVPFTVDVQDYPSCKMVVVKDPDGNGICIHHRKPKA
ncbi:VOC family protein [Oleiharenicola lentus]|uniref:VOC family protein n=1 Tax=Oleiharenicola lentus TaxID=2508720 RepID=UPI003F672B12